MTHDPSFAVPPPPPPSRPVISPDGLWWWNGAVWQPVAPPPAPHISTPAASQTAATWAQPAPPFERPFGQQPVAADAVTNVLPVRTAAPGSLDRSFAAVKAHVSDWQQTTWIAVAGGAVVLLAIAGVLLRSGPAEKFTAAARGLPAKASTRTITGTMTLIDYRSADNGCSSGAGGYDDISEGAQVTIKNEIGEVIATGDLESGHVEREVSCVFAFTVADVPKAKFYAIEVTHRGEVRYSAEELTAKGNDVSLTLD